MQAVTATVIKRSKTAYHNGEVMYLFAKLKPYIVSVAAALAVGILSAVFTMGNMNVYDGLVKPPFAPPGILFPIVWTILFVLMGISSGMVYLHGGGLGVYAIQLAVNFLWSIIFFNAKAYLLAFIWLIVLWILIIVMITKFFKVSKIAAYLQIPYLLWVTFAGVLTFAIYYLN